jgi:hypothetical protein
MTKLTKNIGFIMFCLLTIPVVGQNFNTGLHNLTSPYTIEQCKTRAFYGLNGEVKSIDHYSFYHSFQLAEFKDSILSKYESQPGPFYHRKIWFDSLGRETRNIKITHQTGYELEYDSLGHLSRIYFLKGEYNRNTGEGRFGEDYFTRELSGSFQWYTFDQKVLGVFNKIGTSINDSIIYTLDQKKNIIKIEGTNNGHKRNPYEFEYDSLNRIVKSRNLSNLNNEILVTWEFTYDNKGQLDKTKRKNKDGFAPPEDTREYRTEYEYDHVGNWIKCKTYKDGQLTGVSLREYQYF